LNFMFSNEFEVFFFGFWGGFEPNFKTSTINK
jgi:hypothetical protein